MKLAVEFPSVAYREGAEGVAKLGRAIEEIGFDQLDIFDHVVMGHEMEGRLVRYGAKMPILEALATLSFLAAVTKTVGLGTEVLVLPQRQPTLVAKQFSTLDILSGGRVRVGVGVGWQDSEFEALGEAFGNRGQRMDEAIEVMRKLWTEDPVQHEGTYYTLRAMAMEPKPPQGNIPLWIGGTSPAALRRAGRLGDGWLANTLPDQETAVRSIAAVKQAAEEAGRNPETLGFQGMVSMPPRPGNEDDRVFYAKPDRVAAAAAGLQDAGFGWATINVTGLFLAGARSVDAMIDGLADLHHALRERVG